MAPVTRVALILGGLAVAAAMFYFTPGGPEGPSTSPPGSAGRQSPPELTGSPPSRLDDVPLAQPVVLNVALVTSDGGEAQDPIAELRTPPVFWQARPEAARVVRGVRMDATTLRFDDLRFAHYVLTVYARGYGAFTRQMRLTADLDQPVVTARLDRWASVAGHVTNGAGLPIDGATIQIEGMGAPGPDWFHPSDRTVLLSWQRLVSDPEGRFALLGVPPETTFSLRADKREYGTARSNPLRLARGEARALKLVLPVPTSVVGRVRWPWSGSKTIVTMYKVSAGLADQEQMATADPEGRFRFASVAPGEKCVTAFARDGGRVALITSRVLAEPEKENDVGELVPEAGENLQVRVRTEGDLPAGVEVRCLLNLWPKHEGVATPPAGGPLTAQFLLPLDEIVTIEGLIPGDLALVARLMAPDGTPLAGGYRAETLNVPRTDRAGLREMVLRRRREPTDTAKFHLAIQASPPPDVAPAEMLLHMRLIREGRTIGGTPSPAGHGVFKWETVGSVAEAGAAEVWILGHGWASGPQTVEVSIPPKPQSLTFRDWTRAVLLTVHVVDGGEQPVSGATVEVRQGRGNDLAAEMVSALGTTNGSGRCEMTLLPGFPAQIDVLASGARRSVVARLSPDALLPGSRPEARLQVDLVR